jgi:Alw26I/Eco31I/Esp3I family type II restriction m6 adenine DNA methyltransferase
MDKQTATKIIKDTFENPFDKGRFINLSKNLVKHLDSSKNFTYQGNIIPDAYEQSIQTLERVGKYEDTDGNGIDVLIVRLKKEQSLERARTMQRNFVARYLNGSRGGELKDAALVAFVSPENEDWRFSLVRMDYNIAESTSGRVKVETELTPARRYSFLVGENESSHTAQVQLLPILIDDERKPMLSDFEKAFNIEVVTREFFTKYHDLFLDVKEALEDVVKQNLKAREDFKTKEIDPVNFAKKLLGQIVFLYFLQKKGWFGVGRDEDWGTGPKDFLRRLFGKKIISYGNFFNDILEPLFYEALAVERTDDFYSHFNCKIPFLNGGLFDPINSYDWIHTDILLSNELFSNSEKTKEGDTGTGILDVFDRYNFTVNEDEPLDKEVAVDPEMLGKVFENLLKVKDRKSKGTYYTPREIVHYMCQESLINYLDTTVNSGEVSLAKEKSVNLKLFGAPATQQMAMKTDGYTGRVPREDIEAFVRMGEMAIEHDETAVRKQTEVEQGKIKSTEYNIKLKSIKENARKIDDALANIRVCDPAIGSGAFPVGLMMEIVRARTILTTYIPDETGRTKYHFKRHAIQNCLYGVDIDPGAVEIAKLRLWLSLVVDEEDIKQIQPLPNLDYKIVCGNSLLGVRKDVLNWPLFEELEELKQLYFNETNAKKKLEFRAHIDQLIERITNNKVIFDFEVYFSEVFHEKGGFDVVIANPPYDVLNVTEGQQIPRQLLKTIREMPMYEIALGGKLNLFRLFTARAFSLMQKSGVVTFIIPYAFMCDASAKALRKFVLAEKQLKFIEAFPERDDPNKRLFEAVKMSTCIICIKNSKEGLLFPVRTHFSRKISFDVPTVHLDASIIKSMDPENLSIPLMSDSDLRVVEKMLSSAPKRLRDIGRCYEGEINLTFHKEFLRSNKGSNAPMVKGAGIQRYLLLKKMSQGEVEFLDSSAFLKGNTSSKSKHHQLRRIVMQGITGVNESVRLKMTILDSGVFCGNSANYVLIEDSNYQEEYLLALLNSKLMNWYFTRFSTNSNVNGYQVDNLPIALLSNSAANISDLVKRILAQKGAESDGDVSHLERQIDQLVYELYGLTPEEIAVVEGKK